VPFTGNQLAPLKNLPVYQVAGPAAGWVKLAVVGAHLSGQPLNGQLTERGSRLLQTARTAPDYKLFALTGTLPAKPGLLRTPGFEGPGIEVEVWLMPEQEFGSFVALVPPPLGIGTCELSDGERVKGFVCEEYGTRNMPDITSFGSWRKYLAR
jgi:allophanate hydrolase